jgi:hypothetical protein
MVFSAEMVEVGGGGGGGGESCAVETCEDVWLNYVWVDCCDVCWIRWIHEMKFYCSVDWLLNCVWIFWRVLEGKDDEDIYSNVSVWEMKLWRGERVVGFYIGL